MANFIYSKVTIEPEEAMGKVCDMIRKMPNVEFGKETKNVIDTFYSDYSEDIIDFNWLQNNIGTNWINVFFEDDEINMNSPTIIPAGFLIKLYEICIKDFEDVSISCKWWDETETQCGLAIVKNGFYTEDEAYLESESIYDPSYQPSGFEDIEIVKDWIQTILHIDNFDNMEEDDIRDLFENSKIDEKWNTISNNWQQMVDLCNYAIKNPLEETPILKLKKIAKMSFEMIPNCYPFEN